MNEEKTTISVIRNYKDTVFRKLFGEKKELLSLYNAINNTHYENPDDLEIVTLDNAIYMNMKNDLAFLIDFQLHLYEHQATINPNMPLRFLQYVTKEYEKLVDNSLLYRGKPVPIPAPHFIVFYNGMNVQPEMKILKLSDSFLKKECDPQLELKVTALNINEGNNLKLMEQCQTLKEYTQYVDRMRTYAGTMEIKAAVLRTVDECIEEGILADFLRKNKAEVIAMSIFEYDEEKVLAMIRKDEREDGFAEGEARGKLEGQVDSIFKLLARVGTLSESIQNQIRSERNIETLDKWLTLAAKADSLEAFMKNM